MIGVIVQHSSFDQESERVGAESVISTGARPPARGQWDERCSRHWAGGTEDVCFTSQEPWRRRYKHIHTILVSVTQTYSLSLSLSEDQNMFSSNI